jgi:tetratricopeptide (TPR) repeat protein
MDGSDDVIMGVLDGVYGIDSRTGEILPDRFDLVSNIPMMAGRYNLIKIKNHRGKWFMAAAALVIVALMTTILPEIVSTQCSNEKLFERFHKVVPLSVVRSAQKPDNSEFVKLEIMKLFNSGDYKGVSSVAREIHVLDSINTEIVFAFGISYLMMEDFHEAIRYFEYIDNNTLYYYPALWELALTYLRAGDTKRAAEIMNSLRLQDNIYERDIRKILRCVKAANTARVLSLRNRINQDHKTQRIDE